MTIRPAAGVFIGLAWLLAGCASRPAAGLVPVQTQMENGRAISGVIAAMRPVRLGGPPPATRFAVTGVLLALGAEPPPAAAAATEFVIRRNDDTTAAIVIPAAAVNGNFTLGERVELIDGAQPVLLAGN